ncbi:leukocyte immunoglobulin-like receptor subfamily A member 6 isoform 1-T1 [Sarcophilus harrisii]
MTPILSALLSLGLCLGHRIKTQVDALPRPSLVAENGSLVLLMKSVTLICLGPWEADEYGLVKTQGLRRKKIMRVKPSGREGKFHISSVTLDQAGIYSCRYRKVFLWSEFSDPLELVVTGLYDPPSLSATPSSTVASGQNVSLQCGSELWFDMYALYKDGEQLTQGKAQPHEGRFQTTFHFSLMTSAYGGTYQCYAFLRDSPYLWSAPSDPLELKVTGTVPPSPENLLFGLCLGHKIKGQADALSRPSLMAENGSLALLMKSVTLICLGPWKADEYGLVKNQGLRRIEIMNVKPFGREGKFHISSVPLDQAGTYSCHYRKAFLWSELSDPLELVVTEAAPQFL